MATKGKRISLWAGEQLAAQLTYAYKNVRDARGKLSSKKVAAKMKVSPSTVNRWLRQGLPQKRQIALAKKIRPSKNQLSQERLDLGYARASAIDVASPPEPLNPSWGLEGWLERHTLYVVWFPKLGICVPRISRDGAARAEERLRSGGGIIIEKTRCKNRFVAEVAKGELLIAVAEWRVVLPSGILRRGRTQAFLKDAPRKRIYWISHNPKVKVVPIDVELTKRQIFDDEEPVFL